MKGLGLLIGLIFLLSKIMGKKSVESKAKKYSPKYDDLYSPEEENVKSGFQHYEKKSDIKEVQKKPREDRKKRIETDDFSNERHVSETSSSLLFDNSKDIKKELVKSIIYSEVIGKPKSLRK